MRSARSRFFVAMLHLLSAHQDLWRVVKRQQASILSSILCWRRHRRSCIFLKLKTATFIIESCTEQKWVQSRNIEFNVSREESDDLGHHANCDPKYLHISISDLNTSSSSLTSPNRPPLVAVCDNIVRGGHRPNGNAGGAGGSMSSSATSSPGAQVDDEIQ